MYIAVLQEQPASLGNENHSHDHRHGQFRNSAIGRRYPQKSPSLNLLKTLTIYCIAKKINPYLCAIEQNRLHRSHEKTPSPNVCISRLKAENLAAALFTAAFEKLISRTLFFRLPAYNRNRTGPHSPRPTCYLFSMFTFVTFHVQKKFRVAYSGRLSKLLRTRCTDGRLPRSNPELATRSLTITVIPTRRL